MLRSNESSNAVIRAAAENIIDRFGSFLDTDFLNVLNFTHNGTIYVAKMDNITDAHGLCANVHGLNLISIYIMPRQTLVGEVLLPLFFLRAKCVCVYLEL